MPSHPQTNTLAKLPNNLINAFEEQNILIHDERISVNLLVSKVASWYEKIRNAMDYGSDETILRRTIERILKRRLFLYSQPKSLAEDLIRELIWGGYFPNDSVPVMAEDMVAKSIDSHLKLKEYLARKKLLTDQTNTFIIQLLSCDIHRILAFNKNREAMANFMFHILKDSVEIADDSKQTRDVQVFIAVRKNFGKDDSAFLKYRLFNQIFGRLSEQNVQKVSESFLEGYKEIKLQLTYPKKDRIFNHIKKVTPPFLILYDLLSIEKGKIRSLVKNEDEFRGAVFLICAERYGSIKSKVRTAIVRSFIFILLTKAFIALFIEGTFERLFFGQVQWLYIGLNTVVPPTLMVLAGLGIKTPGEENSEKIYKYIRAILFEDYPKIAPTLIVRKKGKTGGLREFIFSILWLLAILLSFGLISIILTKLHFNILSQGIFLFFIAIISFLTYRIYQTANVYSVIFIQNIFTPILDFFFVPIIRVGRRLTEGLTQVNFMLIVIDFMIEAPFKGLVGFFEQWFVFLAAKKEELE